MSILSSIKNLFKSTKLSEQEEFHAFCKEQQYGDKVEIDRDGKLHKENSQPVDEKEEAARLLFKNFFKARSLERSDGADVFYSDTLNKPAKECREDCIEIVRLLTHSSPRAQRLSDDCMERGLRILEKYEDEYREKYNSELNERIERIASDPEKLYKTWKEGMEKYNKKLKNKEGDKNED